MSVSITHPQILKDVAATLATLATDEPYVGPSRSLPRVANEMLRELGFDLTLDRDILAGQVYNTLKLANADSLISMYPNNEENARQRAEDLERLDSKAHFIPCEEKGPLLTPALSSFVAKLSVLMHGHHDEVPGLQNLHDWLHRVSVYAINAMVLDNKPSGSVPTVQELAESLTRLSANGDYLYGEQSALRNMLRVLPSMSNQIAEYDGDSVLLTLYKQTRESTFFTLPFGNETWKMDTLIDNRIGKYNVSGDIPYAVQADADLVNMALLHINNDLQMKPLLNTDLYNLTPEQQKQVKSTFSRFILKHMTESQSQRFEPYSYYAHLSFNEAREAIARDQAPSHHYVLVSSNDPVVLPENVGGHPQDPERYRQIRSVVSPTVMLVKPDTGDLDAVKAIMPTVKTTDVYLNKLEKRYVTSGYLRPVTAAEFAFSATVAKAYADLGLPNKETPLSHEQVARKINDELKSVLPGFGTNSMEAVSLGVKSLGHSAAEVVSNIKAELPELLREMLRQHGEVKLPVPSQESPSEKIDHGDVTLSNANVKMSMARR